MAAESHPVTAAIQTCRGPTQEGFHHIGHSTHWLVMDGVKILTDPWIKDPTDLCLLHDVPPAPFPCDPDLVLITHRHGDHFDLTALDLIHREAKVVVPEPKLVDAVQKLGFADVVIATDPTELRFRQIVVRAPAGKHLVPERTYHIQGQAGAVFFGGDTMLTEGLLQFAARHRAALAILPAERSTILGIRSVMDAQQAGELATTMSASCVLLTHHESKVSRRHPVGWFVRLRVARPEELDARFRIPSPGDYLPFPWMEKAS